MRESALARRASAPLQLHTDDTEIELGRSDPCHRQGWERAREDHLTNPASHTNRVGEHLLPVAARATVKRHEVENDASVEARILDERLLDI